MLIFAETRHAASELAARAKAASVALELNIGLRYSATATAKSSASAAIAFPNRAPAGVLNRDIPAIRTNMIAMSTAMFAALFIMCEPLRPSRARGARLAQIIVF